MALEIPQVTYNNRPPVAFAGQLGDSGPWDIRSCLAEAVMDAGLGVVYGTQPSGADPGTPVVDLPANTGEVAKFMGVALYQSQREPTGTANRYAAKDPVPVLKRGRIWVQVDATAAAALTAEGAVYLVHSGAQAGKFRQDTGAGGTAATLVSGARCVYAGTEGGIALVDFNIP
jgi:hypothetical protein